MAFCAKYSLAHSWRLLCSKALQVSLKAKLESLSSLTTMFDTSSSGSSSSLGLGLTVAAMLELHSGCLMDVLVMCCQNGGV